MAGKVLASVGVSLRPASLFYILGGLLVMAGMSAVGMARNWSYCRGFPFIIIRRDDAQSAMGAALGSACNARSRDAQQLLRQILPIMAPIT